jgi:hypothetical protein
VYFTLASTDARFVRFYDFATRRTHPAARVGKVPPALGGLGLSVSRDERFLLYAQTEDEESDVMLVSGADRRIEDQR